MILNNCPLCRHEVCTKKHDIKDYSVSQETFSIVECQNCKFLFTSPRPDNSEIGKYYDSSAYISHTNQRTGLFGRAYQFLRMRAIGAKEDWISKHVQSGELLDFGCGTGEFLNYCRTKGWRVIGIEIADNPRLQAKEKYGLNVISPSEIDILPVNEYDVVSLWHVLEHLDDLHGTLNNIISKIKTNGLLVVAVPNPDSWDAIYYKEFWAAWDVPIHFYHFKKEHLISLTSKFGLELLEIKNMPYDAYYISLLSEEYKSGKKNWLKAFYIGMLSNLKAGKNNASSLTYIFKKL